MIKDITIGQYIPGESFVHKLDPRLKILISLLFFVDLFLVNNFEGYLFVIIFILILLNSMRLLQGGAAFGLAYRLLEGAQGQPVLSAKLICPVALRHRRRVLGRRKHADARDGVDHLAVDEVEIFQPAS